MTQIVSIQRAVISWHYMIQQLLSSAALFRKTLIFSVLIAFASLAVIAQMPAVPVVGSPAEQGGWYLLLRHQGVFKGTEPATAGPRNNRGLPARVVYPFGDQGIKQLTALGCQPENPGNLAVTTSSGLYFSTDGGNSFMEIPLKEPVAASNYITSVAAAAEGTFYLGTSFNGFFVTRDSGKSWIKLSENIPGLYRGAGFYEEISGIAVDPAGKIALAASFTSEIYLAETDAGPWTSINFPYTDEIRGIWFNRDGDIEVWGGKGLYNLHSGKWSRTENPFHGAAVSVMAPDKADRAIRAADKFGIYLNPNNASGEKLKSQLDFLAENGLNSVTVDMKDDWGWITYDSVLKGVEDADALRPRFDLDELIQACHARGVYVIGRVVVFKDKRMYTYNNNQYAIWDPARNAPWGNRIAVKNEETGETSYEQREFWVDPFSEEIWRYNLNIARELQSRGVDEVQFDYIRFPSDGDLSKADYRHRRTGMSRIEALESFLAMVREQLTIPISTDLYGFNSWYRMGNWIGQNIELVSHYVDVICPMFYPSHFPRQFRKDLAYLDRAEWIYREGSMRSARIAQGRSIIRPYVQAFLLPFEFYMEEPEYTEYLQRQLKGTDESPASGFTLWNNTNRYYMVKEPLNKYTGTARQTARGTGDNDSVLE